MTDSRRLPLAGIDAAILVGGLGTRLRGVVDDVPKPLAPVAGRPFLFYLLDMLANQAVRSITLCCGYKAELVGKNVGTDWRGIPVKYSIEANPMGTGGAVSLAHSHFSSDLVLLLNGDSWFQPDFTVLRSVAGQFDAVLALARIEDAARFGTVEVDGHRVVRFVEKQSGRGFINAGVYLIRRSLLDQLPAGPSSLERDLFPTLAADGRLGGLVADSPFIDIGVPESYAAAGEFFASLGPKPWLAAPAVRSAT